MNALKFLSTQLNQQNSLNKLTFNIATGCGKTLIMAMIAFQALLASSDSHIVIVSPTIPLVLQTRDALLRILKEYFKDLYPLLAPHLLAVCAGQISPRAFSANHALKEGGNILVICWKSFHELVNQPEFISQTSLFILDESHLVEKDIHDYRIQAIQKAQSSRALKLCFSAPPKLDTHHQFSYTREEGIRDGILVALALQLQCAC